LNKIMSKDEHTQQKLAEHDALLKNQQSAFLDLQRVVGDISKILGKRPEGQFSGSTEPNPKGRNQT
jgi:hypothetical protein